jgi:hypothetical protein
MLFSREAATHQQAKAGVGERVLEWQIEFFFFKSLLFFWCSTYRIIVILGTYLLYGRLKISPLFLLYVTGLFSFCKPSRHYVM